MTNWEENERFMLAVTEVDQHGADFPRDRPKIEVALFWHDPTGGRLGDSTALAALSVEDAQPAYFFPAFGGRPPAFNYHSTPSRPGWRRVAPDALAFWSA
jgi:hypothetical protein